MSPKEKADELISKYGKTECCIITKEDSVPAIVCDRMTFRTAARCASIAIDEVLSFVDARMQGWLDVDWIVYLEEVKKELNKYEQE